MSAMSTLFESESLYISDSEVCEVLEISQVTLWRRTKNDGFPKASIRGKRPRKAVLDWLKEKGLV